jgi:hypothetical protein
MATIKRAFTDYLRSQGIKYITYSGGYVQINNFSFHFNDKEEIIIMRCNAASHVSWCFPYSTASGIMQRFALFRNWLQFKLKISIPTGSNYKALDKAIINDELNKINSQEKQTQCKNKRLTHLLPR